LKDHFRPGGSSDLADRIALDAVALAQSDDALAFEIHYQPLRELQDIQIAWG